MIYLAIALYAEAKPFIQALGLKKQETHCRFSLFTSDTHTLILTGTGSLSAAIADTWLLSRFSPLPGDCFAQIGTAGYLSAAGSSPADVSAADIPTAPLPALGSLYLCHKITDAQTNRSVYPDMLYHSDFAEARLITYPVIQTRSTRLQSEVTCLPTEAIDLLTEPSLFCPLTTSAPTLADMEGYGGYQAALEFLPPYRIFTWKVLSDYSNQTTPDADEISRRIAPHTENILSWLTSVSSLSKEEFDSVGLRQERQKLQEQETESVFPAIWKLAEAFDYSTSQRHHLHQLLLYAHLIGRMETDLLTGLSDTDCSFHPAQRKQEGKRILYELEQRLLS